MEAKTNELVNAERLVAVGQMTAMMGHDLRGPLQTIHSAVEVSRTAPEKRDEMLDMIEEASRRAARMIQELRNQISDQPLNVDIVNLKELIKTSVGEIPPSKSYDVVLEIDESLESVSLDPDKMRRVLNNLIQNAHDAKMDGGILTIEAERSMGNIIVTVSDTGVGIPEGEMPNLFKPFNTTKPKGMGLGLVFCKRAVEAHRGTISVKSKTGKGTTVTLSIPDATSDLSTGIQDSMSKAVDPITSSE